MNVAWRIARRELRGGLRGFYIFLTCLALGVAAIAAVGSVRAGIEAGLAREGAAILGGDAQAEFTYRFASAEERAWLKMSPPPSARRWISGPWPWWARSAG